MSTQLASLNEGEVYLHAPLGRTLRAVTFANEGRRICAISDRDEFFCWRMAEPREPPTAVAFREQDGAYAAISVLFNPLTDQLLSSGSDSLILLWPPAENRDDAVPLTLVGHERPTHAMALTPDGRRLLAGDGNWQVFLWDIDTGRWRERACAVVNRNLTEDEWRAHVGDLRYEKTCP